MACFDGKRLLLYFVSLAAADLWSLDVPWSRSSSGSGHFGEWTVVPTCRIHQPSSTCRGIDWRYGAGAPTGLDWTSLSGLGSVTDIEAMDFNGDGHVDMIIGLADGGLRYYENGAAGLDDRTSVTSPFAELVADSANLPHAAPLVVDLDHDTVVDLLIGYTTPDGMLQVDAYLSTSDYMRKADYVPMCCDLELGDHFSLQAVDLDGDLDQDIVVSGGTRVEYFENVNGEFVHWPETLKGPFVEILSEFGKVVFADMDGDGVLDIVGKSRTTGSFGTAYQVRPGVFTWENMPAMDEKCGLDCLYDVVDVNGDGAPDFVFQNGASTQAFVTSPSGTFTETGKVPLQRFLSHRAPYMGDWNSDGRPDVVAVCPEGKSGPELVVYFEDFELGFTSRDVFRFRLEAPAAAAALVDLNGDGVLDVITHGWHQDPQPPEFYVRHGDTISKVAASSLGIDLGPITDVIGTTLAVTPVDMNGDQLVDLAVFGGRGWGAGTAAFLIKRTADSWETLTSSPLATLACPASCEPPVGDPEHWCRADILDFDGDGHMDAFTWAATCGLTVFRNNGESLVELALPKDSSGKTLFSPWTDTGLPWSGAGRTHLRTTFFDKNHDGLVDLAIGSDTPQVRFFANSICTMPNPCSGHGACDPRTGTCSCLQGYSGAACTDCEENWYGVSSTLYAVRPFSCVRCPDYSTETRCMDDSHMKSLAEEGAQSATGVWLAMGTSERHDWRRRLSAGCTVGQFLGASNQCYNCPAGRYHNNSAALPAGIISCMRCPRGKYLATDGATSVADCNNCTNSSMTLKEGATDITACMLPETGLELNCTKSGTCSITLHGTSLFPYKSRVALVNKFRGCGSCTEMEDPEDPDDDPYHWRRENTSCSFYRRYPTWCGPGDDEVFYGHKCCICRMRLPQISNGITDGDGDMNPEAEARNTLEYSWSSLNLGVASNRYLLCWCSGADGCGTIDKFSLEIGYLSIFGPDPPAQPIILVRGEVYTNLGPILGEGIDNTTDVLKVMTICGVGEFLPISDGNTDGTAHWVAGNNFSLGEDSLSAVPYDSHSVCWCKMGLWRRCDQPYEFKVVAHKLQILGVGRGQEKECVVGQRCPAITKVAGVGVALKDRIVVQSVCGGSQLVDGFPGSRFAEVVRWTTTWTFAFTAKCKNNAHGWVDKHGYTCDDYAGNQWCHGGYAGYSWNSDWGSISDYANMGKDALAACCQCKAGATEKVLEAAAHSVDNVDVTDGFEDPPPRRLSNCLDTNGDSMDRLNYDCQKYYTNFQSCGTRDDNDFTASDMCCACNGGVANSNCTDFDEYFDVRDLFGSSCSYYEAYPSRCGDYDDDDFTAAEMCCVCARGCLDTSHGASDRDGHSCLYYKGRGEKCGTLDDDDFTASSVCCACIVAAATSITTPTTTTTAKPCDVVDGVDREGQSCSAYTDDKARCGLYDTGNFSALDVCCACQGVRPEVDCASFANVWCPLGLCKYNASTGECAQVYWKTQGDCEVSPGEPRCVQSWDFESGPYLSNQACTIHSVLPKPIYVDFFDTEWGFDSLTVNGNAYSDKTGPLGVIADTNGLRWESDNAIESRGWKLCVDMTPTVTESESFLSAVSGMYRMCFCRPSSTRTCTRGEDFLSDAGLLTVRGPYIGTLACFVGQTCSLQIHGVGLKIGDEIQLYLAGGRKARPCRGVQIDVGQFDLPNQTVSTPNGSTYDFGMLKLTAMPGIYAMCWRPQSSDAEQFDSFAFAGWLGVYCPPGYFKISKPDGFDSCLLCTTGYYCPGGTATQFGVKTKCASFATTADSGASSNTNCTCKLGYSKGTEGSCVKCPAGKYRDDTNDNCLPCPYSSGPPAAAELGQCTCPRGKYNAADPGSPLSCVDIQDNATSIMAKFAERQAQTVPAVASTMVLIATDTMTRHGVGFFDDEFKATLENAAISSLSQTLGLPPAQFKADAKLGQGRRLAASESNTTVTLIWTLQVPTLSESALAIKNFNKDEFWSSFVASLPSWTPVRFVSVDDANPTALLLNCSTFGSGYAFPFGISPTFLSQCVCTAGYGVNSTNTADDGAMWPCESCAKGRYKEVIANEECKACGVMICTSGSLCPTLLPPLSTSNEGAVVRSQCQCPGGYFSEDVADNTACSVCGSDYFCEGGSLREACRPGSTTGKQKTAAQGDECFCEVEDGRPGRSPGKDCSCKTGFYFKSAKFAQSCERCPVTGIDCPGEFTTIGAQVVHSRPKSKKGFYMASFDTVLKCSVRKNGQSVCLGGYAWNDSASAQCQVGHTGPMCGACEYEYVRDAGGKLPCTPCQDKPSSGALVVGTLFDLFCKAVWAIILGKRAIITAHETRSVDSVLYRIWAQWMAVNGVLQQFQLSEIKLYDWTQEALEAASAAEEKNSGRSESSLLVLDYPEWFTSAWSAVYTWAGSFPDINVGTNQEVMECLAIRLYGPPEGDIPKMAKYLFVIGWWLLYPFFLLVLLSFLLILAAKVAYPITLISIKKSKQVLRRVLIGSGAKVESVEAVLANMPDQKIVTILAEPNLLTDPVVLKELIGIKIMAEIFAHRTWPHIEPQMQALGLDVEFLIKLLQVVVDDKASGALKAYIMHGLLTLEDPKSKLKGIMSLLKTAFSNPTTFANLLNELLTNVEEHSVINCVANYNPLNIDVGCATPGSEYVVFGMFRSTKWTHIVVDSFPILIIAIYSCWDMLAKRFLLSLQSTSEFLADVDGTLRQQYIWLGDTRLQVFSGSHLPLGILGLVGLGVWNVLFLFVIYIVLRRNEKNLKEPRLARNLGFFINGLEPHYFYWEVGVKRMDVLLVYIVTYTSFCPDVKGKIIVYLIIAGTMWAIHNFCRPFDNRVGGLIDRMESRGLATRFFTFALLQILLALNAARVVNEICAVVLISVNLYFAVSTAFLWLMEVFAVENTSNSKSVVNHEQAQDGKQTLDGLPGKFYELFMAKLGWGMAYLARIARMLFRPFIQERKNLEKRVPRFEWLGPHEGFRIHTWDDSGTRVHRKIIHWFIRNIYHLGNGKQRAFAAESCGLMLDHLLTNVGFSTLPHFTFDVIFALPIALRRCQLRQVGKTVTVEDLVSEIATLAEATLQMEDDLTVDEDHRGKTINVERSDVRPIRSMRFLAALDTHSDRKFCREDQESLQFACTAEEICQGMMYLHRHPAETIHQLVLGANHGMAAARATRRNEELSRCIAEHLQHDESLNAIKSRELSRITKDTNDVPSGSDDPEQTVTGGNTEALTVLEGDGEQVSV